MAYISDITLRRESHRGVLQVNSFPDRILSHLDFSRDSSLLAIIYVDLIVQDRQRSEFRCVKILWYQKVLIRWLSYRCKTYDSTDQVNKVMFYLAEKPVLYDGCQVGLCDWQFLRSKFDELASSCKLDICWEGNTAFSSSPDSVVVLLAYAVLVHLGYRRL